jgi:hypothetical protein
MRFLLALGLLMTLCASASAASGVRTHSMGHSKNYDRHYRSNGQYSGSNGQYFGSNGQYSGSFGRDYGGYSRYYGSPNDRGGLVGGDDAGT